MELLNSKRSLLSNSKSKNDVMTIFSEKNENLYGIDSEMTVEEISRVVSENVMTAVTTQFKTIKEQMINT